MRYLAAIILLLSVGCMDQANLIRQVLAQTLPACGQACGDCDAGIVHCTCTGNRCRYPSYGKENYVPDSADIGGRTAYDPDDFTGTDAARISAAGAAADAGDDAVVMTRVYEIDNQVTIYPGVMYTGGVLQRVCTTAPTVTVAADSSDSCVTVDSTDGAIASIIYVATTDFTFDGTLGLLTFSTVASETSLCVAGTLGFNIPVGARLSRNFNILKMSATPSDGIIIDSVRFDGGFDCGVYTQDWRYSNTIAIRGDNTIRNSIFHDTPSENLTTCGATVTGNVAFDLQGSFIHKSCASDPEDLETVADNYIENTNIGTDAVMQHSEGLITFSSNAGNWDLDDNVFRFGGERVFGRASTDEEDGGVTSDNDCYAHFPARLVALSGVDLSNFVWTNNTLIDVPALVERE